MSNNCSGFYSCLEFTNSVYDRYPIEKKKELERGGGGEEREREREREGGGGVYIRTRLCSVSFHYFQIHLLNTLYTYILNIIEMLDVSPF